MKDTFLSSKTIERKYIVPGTSMLRKTEILNMILDIRLLSTRLRLMKKFVENYCNVINVFFRSNIVSTEGLLIKQLLTY